MSTKSEKSIADSLEVNKRLLPHIPFLLQDLWVLGSSIDQIIEIVSSLNSLYPLTKILDLGCGKGAVSVQLAARYGFQAVGIDAMTPFLEEAEKKAVEYNVTHLCQFINQDLHEYVSNDHDYDLVILAALGGIFGSFKNTIAKLQTQVHTGGFIIIDDGYLKKHNQLDRKGYEHYKNYDNTIRELTFFGDRLINQIDTSTVSKNINREYLDLIKRRGEELISKHHELKKDIDDYIRLQAEECDVLENEIEGALWVIRKR
ncbi:MAG: class I SAM-dependent methyltransferase [Ignavibacteriales bacterium]|nr:class I SAM-dependent methyltransferase [Ignavibacteriales bacterium]